MSVQKKKKRKRKEKYKLLTENKDMKDLYRKERKIEWKSFGPRTTFNLDGIKIESPREIVNIQIKYITN